MCDTGWPFEGALACVVGALLASCVRVFYTYSNINIVRAVTLVVYMKKQITSRIFSSEIGNTLKG